jgi:ParB-like chromosome segregation protein Spo0J
MELSKIKPNPNNPRIIKDDSFEKLCRSIQEFPKMMSLRPIVVDSDNMVLGGNMRLNALQHLKFKTIPDEWVKNAAELTENEKRRFIIADNVSGGEWDIADLAANWDREELDKWGVDVDWEVGDIVELPDITTTYNVNIKCDNPQQVDELKDRLGIDSNNIHFERLMGMLV